MTTVFNTATLSVDLCVVGGGLAGLCAGVAAARHGARVALMQDRAMLGGNASSEIRMWVCGAHGANNRETGLIEELALENRYRNPEGNYSVWDGVLYGLARAEKNLELILNCACVDCEMDGDRIVSVTGWQTTTQTWQRVEAKLFADCSGDSVLAPLTHAKWRAGRESASEFGENIAPAKADRKTMGLSCLIQAVEEREPSTFIPPVWAEKLDREKMNGRAPNMQSPMENFWYLELGGENDSIRDSETLRDELLALAYGVWDYVKNAPENREKNRFWRLDWVGMLPGKRESRRYEGDLMLTQNDVRAEGRFPDTVAFGGWTMDDHNPAGFRTKEPPTVHHDAPSPYGIPYRCLYSKNVENLFCAGRNISATHAAMSSSRVMATCAVLGQAVGTAAAIAARKNLTPRGVYEREIARLQQELMQDDCFLPGFTRAVDPLTRTARLICDAPGAENLRSGVDRPRNEQTNACDLAIGQSAAYRFEGEQSVSRARLVFDSDLNRELGGRAMPCNRALGMPKKGVPETLARAFRIEAVGADGRVKAVWRETDNYQRLNVIELNTRAAEIRFTPESTWGAEKCRVFAFEVQS